MRKRSLSANRSAELAARACAMRTAPTVSEQKLWAALRGGRVGGVAFRRQVIIEQRIVDFVAPAAKLVIEVDGAYHAQRASADARRDAELARVGYRVLRIEAELVMRNFAEAVARIEMALQRK
ncbi:MAG: endonuclease domain-containing protein [Myxococcota bacterium]